MTVLELQTIADRADQLRAMAEEHRRSAGQLAAAGHRAQAGSRRLEAMLCDLQATALQASLGAGLRPVAVRARTSRGLPPYQGAGL
jgi:hypothetical protein